LDEPVEELNSAEHSTEEKTQLPETFVQNKRGRQCMWKVCSWSVVQKKKNA
jgi:hypothetical protein